MNGDLDLSVRNKKALDTEIKEIWFMQAVNSKSLLLVFYRDNLYFNTLKSAQYFYI